MTATPPPAGTPLTPLELDALREVANIGCGHAATVLSQMIGRGIMIDVPVLTLAPVADVARTLAPDGQPVAILSMRIVGDLTGATTFVMRHANAQFLCDLLLQRAPGSGGLESPMERSALMEAGNVMASGFLNALSVFLNRILLPSPPRITFGPVATLEQDEASTTSVLVATTNFRFEDQAVSEQQLTGMFLFALDDAARAALFSTLRKDEGGGTGSSA